jgi:hypothetical protein
MLLTRFINVAMNMSLKTLAIIRQRVCEIKTIRAKHLEFKILFVDSALMPCYKASMLQRGLA